MRASYSSLRPSWHVDLSRLIDVGIRRRWYQSAPLNEDLPADSFIDCLERLRLLRPFVQTNRKRRGHKTKTGFGLRVTRGNSKSQQSKSAILILALFA